MSSSVIIIICEIILSGSNGIITFEILIYFSRFNNSTLNQVENCWDSN